MSASSATMPFPVQLRTRLNVDPVLLTQIAGTPDRFYNAPSDADLVRIYRDIAGALPCDFPP